MHPAEFTDIGTNGAGAPAQMIVSAGGTVTDTSAIVNSDPTSFGALTITGPHTRWTDLGDPGNPQTTNGYIVVGNNPVQGPAPASGVASLTVSDGAVLTEANYAVVGHSANSAGQVTVSSGAQWNIGNSGTGVGFLTVGRYQDHGSVLITNDGTAGDGGTVSVGAGGTYFANGTPVSVPVSVILGAYAGGSGTLTVDGTGSQLTTGASIRIGQHGQGVLTVLNGGTVVATVPTGDPWVPTEIGEYAGSTGTLSVTGSGSGFTSTGQMDVGVFGDGTLLVGTGGTVVTGNDPALPGYGFTAGWGPGSRGDVRVSGAGAVLRNTGRFVIGGSGNVSPSGYSPPAGVGTLVIADGALVQTGLPASGYTGPAAAIANAPSTGGSSVTVTGTSSTWQVGGDLLDGNSYLGAGTLAVLGGGTVDIAGNASVGSGSTLSVDGSSGMDIGTSNSFAAGTVLVESGHTLSGDGLVAATLANSGSVVAAAGGTLEITGSVSGTGTMVAADGATLRLDAAPGPGQIVAFGTGFSGGGLILGAPTGTIATQITGIAAGDRIELAGVAVTGASLVAPGTISIATASGTAEVLNNVSFAANAGSIFIAGTDAASGNSYVALSSTTPRDLQWMGPSGGDFADASNWSNTTFDPFAPNLPPGPLDTAEVYNTGTITGTGTVATLQFNGYGAETLAAGAALSAGSAVTLQSSGTLVVAAGATLSSAGTLGAGSGMLDVLGSVSVAGALTNPSGAYTYGEVVTVGGGGRLQVGGPAVVPDHGTLTVGASAAVDIGTSGGFVAGELLIEAGHTLIGAGTISAGTILNSGTIVAASPNGYGTLEVGAPVTGDGTLVLGSGTDLKIDGTIGGSLAVAFAPGEAETLVLGSPGTGFNNPITGFAGGDWIEFGGGITITAASLNASGTLTLDTGSGSYTLDHVGLVANAGTVVTVGTDFFTGDAYVQLESRYFEWAATNGGTLGAAENWNDTTDIQNPAPTPPSAGDNADFAGNGQSLSGTIAVAAASFSGSGAWGLLNGTSLSATRGVQIGVGANGTLVVDQGATLVSASATAVDQIGAGFYNSGSLVTGVVQVNGAGALLDLGEGQLALGAGNATGTLTVGGGTAAAGTVIAGSAIVGEQAGGSGTLAIGAGGMLTLTAAGQYGAGLTIGESGSSGSLASGVVQVSGAGALLDLGGSQLALGYGNATGTLTVGGGTTAAGTVIAGSAIVGEQAGGSGTLAIGAGGMLTLTAAGQYGAGLTIGESGSSGSLASGVVQVSGAGALLDLGGGQLALGYGNATGTLTVGGGTAAAGTVIAGSAIVGEQAGGSGTLAIGAGGMLTLTAGTGLTIGESGSSGSLASGVVQVTGAGALLDLGGSQLILGESDATGILTVSTGGTVLAGSATVGSQSGSGTVAIAGGLLSVAGSITLGNSYGSGATGSLTASGGGTVEATGGLQLWQGGTVAVDSKSAVDIGSSASFVQGAVLVESGQSVLGDGVIAADLVDNGMVVATNSSPLQYSNGGTLEVTGSVSGSGTLVLADGASLRLDGTVAAGPTIEFTQGMPETLILGQPSGTIANAITGFAFGDRIEFGGGITINSASLTSSGTLTVGTSAGSYVLDNLALTTNTETLVSYGWDANTGDAFVQRVPGEFLWTGKAGTDLATPGNWDNIGAQAPATTPPGGSDEASFTNNGGGTLTGTIGVYAARFAGSGAWTLGSGASLSGSAGVQVGTTASNGTLVVSGGARLLSSGLFDDEIGAGAGGAGFATVSGTGATWNAATGIDVGSSAAGALTVTNGGTVSAGYLSVGGVTGNGTVTLDTGTIAAGGAIIGGSSTGASGSLAIGAGGVFTLTTPGQYGFGALTIGGFGTPGTLTSGIVQVSGTGALLDLNGGQLVLGESDATGTLTLGGGGGGTLVAGSAIVGEQAGGSGTLAIGAGGVLTLVAASQYGSGLTVGGYAGSGTVAIDAGGLLSVAGSIALGDSYGSGATGSLTASHGGTVEAAGGLQLWHGGTVAVNSTSGVDIGSSGSFVKGALLVESGQSVLGDGVIAADLVDNGTVTAVPNSSPLPYFYGGTLEVTGSVSGTGTLVVADGASLRLDGTVAAGPTIDFSAGASPETLILGQSAGTISALVTGLAEGDRIELAGAVVTGASLVAPGTVSITTASGTAEVLNNVSFAANAGSIFIAGTDPASGNAYVALGPTTPRTLSWNGGGSDTNFGDAANWSDYTNNLYPATLPPGPLDTAEIYASGSGTITGTGTVATLQFNVYGAETLAAGAALSAGSAVTLQSSGTLVVAAGATLSSAGTLGAGSGTLLGAGPGTLDVLGSVSVAGALTNPSGAYTYGEVVTVGGGGRLQVGGPAVVPDYGTLTVGASAAVDIGTSGSFVAGELLIEAGHTLIGAGTISAGTILNSGTIVAASPNSYGTLEVGASVTGDGTLGPGLRDGPEDRWHDRRSDHRLQRRGAPGNPDPRAVRRHYRRADLRLRGGRSDRPAQPRLHFRRHHQLHRRHARHPERHRNARRVAVHRCVRHVPPARRPHRRHRDRLLPARHPHPDPDGRGSGGRPPHRRPGRHPLGRGQA